MKRLNYDIVLLEDVSAVDRHGMSYMRKGTKGSLVSGGETTSIVTIGHETYELPNASFSPLVAALSQNKAA